MYRARVRTIATNAGEYAIGIFSHGLPLDDLRRACYSKALQPAALGSALAASNYDDPTRTLVAKRSV
jgi:hypothetical protein